MTANQAYGQIGDVPKGDDGQYTYVFSEEEVKRRLGIPMDKHITNMHQDYHTGELIILCPPKEAA